VHPWIKLNNELILCFFYSFVIVNATSTLNLHSKLRNKDQQSRNQLNYHGNRIYSTWIKFDPISVANQFSMDHHHI
jgi:hypothetical protein